MTYKMTAYVVGPTKGWVIEPGGAKREWMEQTPFQGANRCLPLVIANQAGWIIRCPFQFKVTWNGNKTHDSITFDFSEDEQRASRQVLSIFGFGIISFSIPWLFRTSEGVGLLVRGPTNYYKENMAALDGLVETDWAPYTFTMNWKIVKPRTPVWFRKGDPICMILPYPIAMLEQFKTNAAPIDSEPELQEAFHDWQQTRRQQYKEAAEKGTPEGLYRLDYVRGSKPDGTFAKAHWSKLKLAKFESGTV